MFLDLGSLSSLVYSFFELITLFGESVSVPFLAFLTVLFVVSVFAWRSTYTPEHPPVPRPPYVIQITGTPGNGESFSNVRLVSSGDDLAGTFLHPSNTRTRIRFNNFGGGNSGGINVSVSQGGQDTQRVTTTTLHPNGRVRGVPVSQQSAARVLQGSLIQPILQRANSSGTPIQNLIVYHRVNVYHHHHHHHHPAGAPSSSSASAQTTASSSSNVSALPHNHNPAVNTDSSSTEPQDTEGGPSLSASSVTDHSSNDSEIVVSPIEENDEPDLVDLIGLGGSDPNQDVDGDGESVLDRASSSTASASYSFTNEGEGIRRRVIASSGGTVPSQELNPTPDKNQDPSIPTMDNKQSTNEGAGDSGAATSSSEGIDDIRFTIKFLNDTQMDVSCPGGEKIADFKRRHFSSELSANKTVRLIFNGRVLDNDTSTIRESGIFNQCVVHCLIVSRPVQQRQNPEVNEGNQAGTRGLLRGGTTEPGIFFVGFVGVFLILLWFICFHFGQHLFSQSAVVSLTVLTAIFLIGLVAFYLPVHPTNPA